MDQGELQEASNLSVYISTVPVFKNRQADHIMAWLFTTKGQSTF